MFLGNSQEEENKKTSDELPTTSSSRSKSIKYKNMGIPYSNNRKNTTSLSNIEAMLETERIENDNENWSKLSKTLKIKKLLTYAEKYREENNLSDEDYDKLIIFFKDCLDKKKLQRVKDVEYNRETCEIVNIPSLLHNKISKHFTLKNVYKKVSTIKCLPKKKSEESELKIEGENI